MNFYCRDDNMLQVMKMSRRLKKYNELKKTILYDKCFIKKKIGIGK